MKLSRLALCLPACLLADPVLAGAAQPLGAPLGLVLGQIFQLGSALPLGSLSLLGVATASLIIEFRIVRRKRRGN